MDYPDFNPELLFQQATIAHQSQQFDKAESLLRKILEHQPEQDVILSALGGVLLSSGKIQEGTEILEKVTRLHPQNIDAILNLGIAYQREGRMEESFQLISKGASLAPNRPDVQFNFANILLQQQKYPEAIQILKKVIEMDAPLIQAYQTLGSVYAFLEKPSEAVKIYEEAMVVFPDDLNTLISFGNLLINIGQLEKAEAVFIQATEKHSAHFIPFVTLGKFYMDTGREEEGLVILEKAHSLNPDDFDINNLLGHVLKTLGKKNAAEKYFEQALAIKPGDDEVLKNIRSIASTKIPYWHFEMLADLERNTAYQKAIEKVVTKESIILDIGTGSGLLAMMAARAGAQKITACEMHQELAATAKQIVQLNGYEKVINVLEKKSSNLMVGKDLPTKVNLIISEILDAGAIGEGAIPSIRQAVQNLAVPDVKLIPAKVNIYGQLIEIPSRSLVAPIREISGFDLSPFEKYRVPDEYLKINLKAEKYRVLSPVIPLLKIDFYNLLPVLPTGQAMEIPLELNITQDGMAQAMVFWFDLFLDEEIIVSSKRDGELEHWGQALFCFPNPQKVKAGEVLSLTLLQSEQNIRFRM